MERIKSFEINHNVLTPGFYISREDGDVITYDLRTRKPNAGDYMTNAAMHSLEQLYTEFSKKGIKLVLSHVNEQPMSVMEKAGFTKKVGKENFCSHIDLALARAKEIVG